MPGDVSALLRHGPGQIEAMRHALERWLEWQHLDSLTGMIGRASFEASPDPPRTRPVDHVDASARNRAGHRVENHIRPGFFDFPLRWDLATLDFGTRKTFNVLNLKKFAARDK